MNFAKINGFIEGMMLQKEVSDHNKHTTKSTQTYTYLYIYARNIDNFLYFCTKFAKPQVR